MMMKTTVVNKYKDEYDVYCGRGSIFGNPYEVDRDGTREECIEKFAKWFAFLLRDSTYKRELVKLKGKRLACYCAPQECHCDVIADYLNTHEI